VYLFAFGSAEELAPVFVFGAIFAGVFWVLAQLSRRNTHAEDRLERIGRPKSLADLDLNDSNSRQRFAGLKSAMSSLGASMEPQSSWRRTG
jgi:tight adherence protein C